ncbi:MAG: hypothetical protein RR295_01735 [Oscillospiraceae bacterium]
MKKFRRILSLLLVVTALTGLMTVGASAASDAQLLEAKVLSAMGLFRGYDNTGNNFGLDNTLTREQSLALLIRMKGESAAAEAWKGEVPYTDVAANNSLLPYIGYGKEMGYTKGIGDGKFGVGRTAGMQEMTVFALRGLGYSDSASVGDFTWDTALTVATTKGVLENAILVKPFTRGNAVDILFNSMAANIKGQDYDLLSKLINEGAVTQAQYDKAMALLPAEGDGKADAATAATNKAIDAYNAALTAYNKTVDAANALNLGTHADVKKQVNDMSAVIQEMTAQINAVVKTETPFTAEQVKACNQVTASVKTFTVELQKLVDAAKAASAKPESMVVPVTIVNKTGVDLSTLAMSAQGDKDFGDNLLKTPLKDKQSGIVDVTFTPDTLVWDLLVGDAEGTNFEIYGIDFSKCKTTGATITLTYDGTNVIATWG